MLLFFYLFLVVTFLLLFISNFIYVRLIILSFALGLVIFSSKLLINYLIYNFYFDSLFIILKILNITFFNFFYIMYDGISLMLIFLTFILYLVVIVSS